MDLADAPHRLGAGKYDAVMCNPPYGKRGGALVNPSDALSIARHEVLTTLEDCARAGAALLRNGGRYFMIHQADRLLEIAQCMAQHHMQVKRVRLCHPRPDRCAHLVLLEAVKLAKEGCIFLPPLVIHDAQGRPTPELARIYRGEKTV